VLALLGALVLPAGAQALNPDPKWFSYDRPAEYVAEIDHTLMVPMRDGKSLACSIYRPKPSLDSKLSNDQKFPAIVNNIEPYQRWQNDSQNTYLADHGYVVMSCDARGAKESTAAGPLVDPFGETEQHDMYDLVEWMAAQPWSNGDVGIGGYSYGAILAYLGAAQRPPHLRVIAARASYANLYKEMVYLGGIRGLDVAGWWLGLIGNTTIGATWRQHPLYDSYWAERVIDTKYDALRASQVPILDYGGWYDIYPDGETRNYMALRDQTWLVMNWGAHLDTSPVPDNALLAWYDHWLKKLPTAPLPDDKVISYEMPKVNSASGHGWTTFPDWPPPTSGPVRLRFNTDASLADAPDKHGSVSYQVDPADGSATYWNHGYSEASGPADEQAQDLARVTFTTSPLKKDVVVAGATEVNLRAALSATDGNLVVRMTDVEPSGASIIVASGWLKASHRLGHERLAPIAPGTLYDFPVHVWATHWRFAAGHRLRLSVSSGDLPRIEPDAPPGSVDIVTGAGGSYADVPVLGAAPPAAARLPFVAPSAPAAEHSKSARLGLPSRRCVSRRRFRVHLHAPRGTKLAGVTVYVNGRRAAVVSPRRLRVDLRGLPKGRVRVRLSAVTTSGKHLRQTRVYRTCAARRRRS
jgi:predicted acyl esterase